MWQDMKLKAYRKHVLCSPCALLSVACAYVFAVPSELFIIILPLALISMEVRGACVKNLEMQCRMLLVMM